MHEQLDKLNEQDAEMDALLAERYRRALQASSDVDGRINFDWLVMHIWLAMTDAVQAAFASANACCLAGGKGTQVFDTHLKRMRVSVERVLPRIVPLMANFVELKEIHQWRKLGSAVEVAKDPDFLCRARDAGLPLTTDDLIYALGSEGPSGEDAFMATVAHVKRTMPT